ncbi:hypothetical protein MtrunA17_Chr2g0327941 [Medicago truncatula]|uniref:Uncharacterized protein n=1 Tax=Medicago truncatula TaxID=3880 RepID=Q2HU67_MEDTR|nr:hypothetical protein MtrDRAFT_AC149210g2v2 [Medicago truncatula]AES67596.1 hypothetical protein MTR_2g096600 [Medicago truncatula]RHN76060.1 hypothetical protein MtrunA17_Chr2g0327941 [Medicago truncatula]
MDTLVIDLNTKIVAIYYNRGKLSYLFRVRNYVTLFGFKDQLNQINRQMNHVDTRRVDSVEYRRPLTDSAGRVQFTQMNLMNDDDVRLVFLIFSQYNTKEPPKLDVSLVTYVEEIQKV